MRARILAHFGLVAAMVFAAGSACGQATSTFTYQGRLTSSGVPQGGNFDFRFSLWNDPLVGVQYGPTVSAASLPVSAGLFTTQLDFGRVFDSTRLWLEIQVRPSGGGNFTTLAPRQELTSAPYANGLSLPASGSATSPGFALWIGNSAGHGVAGIGGTGGQMGVYGACSGPAGNGVYGACNTDANSYGVWGSSTKGVGVVGDVTDPGFAGGYFSAISGYGLIAVHESTTGGNPGLLGETWSTDPGACAIIGHQYANTPGTFAAGVQGMCDGTSTLGMGVVGTHAGTGFGVYGSASGPGCGVVGNAGAGGGIGVFGSSDVGLYGAGTVSSGVFGYTLAASTSAAGVNGHGQTAIRGDSSSGGTASFGVYGVSTAAGGNGVRGEATGPNAYGIWGFGNSGAYAGYFDGEVHVNGALSKAGGSFKIDHPLDPANKFLYHSFVESPDMMNVYNGNVTTDADGNATVTMPEWFQALNRDYRYQLTVIGGGSAKDRFPQVRILRKIDAGNTFTIGSSSGNVEVSWQVTGIRQDAWANAHRIPVEQAKSDVERGRFIHPELFGQPDEMSISGLKGKPESAAPPTPANLAALQSGQPVPSAPVAPMLLHKLPPQMPANDVSGTPLNQVDSDN